VARIGPAAIGAFPALDRVIPDPSADVRAAAVHAVRTFGPLGSSRAPLLVRRAFEAEATVAAEAVAALRAVEGPLPERLREILGMIGKGDGPEGLLLGLTDAGMPPTVADALARVALARARWLDSLRAGRGPAPELPASTLRDTALAALAAAERAAARRRLIGREEAAEGGSPHGADRRARDREAAWLLAFLVRSRMAIETTALTSTD
jgi:hypothetical protein